MEQRSGIRIIIADDHPAMRLGLAGILASDPRFDVVAKVGSADEAVRACGELGANVVLMDLRLPGGGVDGTREIRKKWPDTQVLIVTSYTGDEDIYQSIQAGACGYLTKDLTADELVDAVLLADSGKRVLPLAIKNALKERALRNDLSDREHDVVELLVMGYSNREISVALDIGAESVKSHLKSIFRKLGVTDRTQAAVEAIRTGIIHLNSD